MGDFPSRGSKNHEAMTENSRRHNWWLEFAPMSNLDMRTNRCYCTMRSTSVFEVYHVVESYVLYMVYLSILLSHETSSGRDLLYSLNSWLSSWSCKTSNWLRRSAEIERSWKLNFFLLDIIMKFCILSFIYYYEILQCLRVYFYFSQKKVKLICLLAFFEVNRRL